MTAIRLLIQVKPNQGFRVFGKVFDCIVKGLTYAENLKPTSASTYRPYRDFFLKALSMHNCHVSSMVSCSI